MKKMITLLSTAAVALTFSLFSLGCAGSNSMDTMTPKSDTMHSTTTESMKSDTHKSMPDTMGTMDAKSDTMHSETMDSVKSDTHKSMPDTMNTMDAKSDTMHSETMDSMKSDKQ